MRTGRERAQRVVFKSSRKAKALPPLSYQLFSATFPWALSCLHPVLGEGAMKGVPKALGFHCSPSDVAGHVRKLSQPLLSSSKVIQKHRGISLNDC